MLTGIWGWLATVAVGVVTLVTLLIQNRRIAQSRSWPSTTGTFAVATMWKGRDGWTPQILYTYSVNGRRYTGDRWRFGLIRYPDRASTAAAFSEAGISFGAPCTVYYDPDLPYLAVLVPGGREWAVAEIVGILALVTCFAGVLFLAGHVTGASGNR